MTMPYEFQKQFPDDEACLHHIMIKRHGGSTLDCPKCGIYSKFYRMSKERGYVCQHCGHHLHPCVGTPMERSRSSLHKWFYCHVSVCQLPSWRFGKGVATPTRRNLQNRMAYGA